jgi:hypothetical protein
MKHSVARLAVLLVFVGLLSLGIVRQINLIRAEQVGGSPESGADSRLKELADSLDSLSYGDPNNGAIGDWGGYWNRISSAAQDPFNDAKANGLFNGGNADFPQNVGGIHDANPMPEGSYTASWTTCSSANDYCGTGESIAEKRDENTGLIWSERISASANWFTANNCKYPNELPGDDGVCNTNGEVACQCVKLTGPEPGGNGVKTGCEAQGDGNWRLPYQKETMMVYIDGSAAELTNAAATHWSSTTASFNTHNAWYTNLSVGTTSLNAKTTSNSFRCVR